MTQQELFDKVVAKASEFGFKKDENAVLRCFIKANENNEKEAYWFGFIGEAEPPSGVYKNLSLAIFPGNEVEVKQCVVSISIGTDGLTYDRELASQPGTRRLFLKLRTDKNKDSIFFKTRFDNSTSSLSEIVEKTKHTPLSETIKQFKTFLPAAELINLADSPEEGLNQIYNWLAIYGNIRNWGRKDFEKVRNKHLSTLLSTAVIDYKQEVEQLIDRHKFVMLQGAPGVGKTFTALKIAENYDTENVFFIQFHAETSYADFVWGLRPNTNGNGFISTEGILLKAIDKAMEEKQKNKNVLLIIDEINRANLSNVLGPVFYLFEKKRSSVKCVHIKIGDKEYTDLPDNLHVIATMNTADRSLAVVDFALRRRFIWYTLRPQALNIRGKKFRKDFFDQFSNIFEKHATDEELNLQPGPSYFIADNDDEMNERLQYELTHIAASGHLSNWRRGRVKFRRWFWVPHKFYIA